LRDKKKGRAAAKQTRPKRKAEAKRSLDTKAASRENQYLLLKFDKDHSGLTFDEAGAILSFIRWLEDNDYIILDSKKSLSEEVKIER